MAKYFLYSSHERDSREQLPKYLNDPEYLCIDWMEEHDKVKEFLDTGHPGPPSFPTIVEEAEIASLPKGRLNGFIQEILNEPAILPYLADLLPAVEILQKVGPEHPLTQAYWKSLKPKVSVDTATIIENTADKYSIPIVEKKEDVPVDTKDQPKTP